MAAIDIDGGVPSTTLNGAITSGATSITVADGSSYPDGTNGNFYIVIDLGAAAEETIECSARSSNTFTVATRGADGTSAASHDNGATVQHVVPALTLQEANTHANQTTGTPHGSAYVTPSGNVATATALETGRTIVLSGDVSGTSGSFDGTANATITTTVADYSHNHTDATITGTLSNDTTGNAATATALATARLIGGVSFDGTANITLPGVNATGSQDTTGNATTATALETARTIGGVSFDGTANINLPGVNAPGTEDTSGTAAVATTATLTDAGTDTTCFPVLAGAATGNEGLETDASALTYNASTGTLSATNLAGTLTTAAQTNITSVGTLGSLTVTNSVVAADFRATGGTAADPSFMIEDLDTGFFSTGGGTFAATCNSTSVTTWTTTRFRPSSDNAIQLGESGLRWTAVYAVNGTIQTSDMTLKERKGDALGLDFVNDLKPFQGRWKDEDDAACRQFLSAQDVHRSLKAAGIDPEDSGMWHDGEHEGLNYSEMVPVLVKAVQELTARLEAVEGS